MVEKLKGNLVIGQSGGPTAVVNCSLAAVIEEARKHPEIVRVYGMLNGIEGILNERMIDLSAVAQKTIKGLSSTPSAALGSCRSRLTPESYTKILDTLRAYDIRYFVYIGGNDSMDTSHRISEIAQEASYDLRVVGVPKTIDNDLEVTDHSPGYGSVARWAAISTMEAGLDSEAIGIIDKVKVIEVMGRDTGWIAAATTLGKKSDDDPPHITCVPEVPFSREKLLEGIKKTCDRLGFCVITACEGLRDENGDPLVVSDRTIDADGFGHRQLGGVGDYICQLVATKLNMKARYDKPGTIQRVSMSLASRVDIKEAYAVGREAVKQAIAGETDKMITLVREPGKTYRCSTGLVDLERVANATKALPNRFINKEGNGMTKEFRKYAMPLIGDPLPQHVKLNKLPVPKRLRT